MLLFFNFLFRIGCACAGALALVALSLLWLCSGYGAALLVVACVPVFGGAALVSVVVALVAVFLRSGCILCYFANLGKMGVHTHTRAHAYPRNNF